MRSEKIHARRACAYKVHSKNYHEEISWLAIGVSADVADALHEEPIFWRPAICDQSRVVPAECQGCQCVCGEPRVV